MQTANKYFWVIYLKITIKIDKKYNENTIKINRNIYIQSIWIFWDFGMYVCYTECHFSLCFSLFFFGQKHKLNSAHSNAWKITIRSALRFYHFDAIHCKTTYRQTDESKPGLSWWFWDDKTQERTELPSWGSWALVPGTYTGTWSHTNMPLMAHPALVQRT